LGIVLTVDDGSLLIMMGSFFSSEIDEEEDNDLIFCDELFKEDSCGIVISCKCF